MSNDKTGSKKTEGLNVFLYIGGIACLIVIVCIASVLVGIKIGEGRETDIKDFVEQWQERQDELDKTLQSINENVDELTNNLNGLDKKIDSFLNDTEIEENEGEPNADSNNTPKVVE